MSDWTKIMQSACAKQGVEHLADTLALYIEHGVEPGSFVTACLENNLAQAVGRADTQNVHLLVEIATVLWNDVPADAWGSKAKVDAWIEAGGINGMTEKAVRENG